MKKQIYFFAIAGLSFLTSCVVLKTQTSKTMDIYGVGVIQNPVLVDLDVKETKTVGSATGGIGTSLENLQKYAVADALCSENADILVEPKFESEISEGQTTITVTGFPAKYKNFRSMKPEDVQMLQLSINTKVSVYEPPKEPQKRRDGPYIAILSLVTIIALALALGR